MSRVSLTPQQLNTLDAISSASPEYIYIFGRDLSYLYVSKSGARAFGLEQSDIIGKSSLDLGIPIETMASFNRQVEHVSETGIAIIGEVELQTVVGIREYNYTLKEVSLDGVNPVIVATFSDITEQKHLEDELRESANRIQLLLDSTDEGIYGLDVDGFCTLFNRAAASMTGFTAEEVLGKDLHHLIHHSHSDGSPYPLDDCPIVRSFRAGGGTRVDNEVFWHKDGSPFPVEYSSYPVIEHGEVKGAVVTFTDITARKKAAELSDALNRINNMIISTFNVDEIMQTVTVEAARVLESESAVLMSPEQDYWVARYTYGTVPQELVSARIPAEEAQASYLVSRTHEPLVVNDAPHDPRINNELAKRFGVRSEIVVPLMVRDEIMGAIYFHYYSTAVEFSDAQLDFARQLGLSTSLALENARLYEVERNIADTLQDALLTIPARMPNLSFGHLHRSATEAAKVGGDFYDLFKLKDGITGIIMGDVSGKGLSAAAVTSLVKNTIRAYALDSFSPAEVIAKTNDAIYRVISATSSSFITVFFGMITPATGRFVYCNAGHPPAILQRRSGGIELLSTGSPVIGAFDDLRYDEAETSLNEGDILLLYTDGVIEARCDDGFFGEARLQKLMNGMEFRPAPEVAQLVFSEVMQCTGGRLSDDLALFAVSIQPS
ncbi:MAG TPA: SpoIIE family protein phosphatase [Candidatus Aquicultor sp.]|jgi:PAS domain S-box-containing protein